MAYKPILINKKMAVNNYIRMFSHCIPVLGKKKSIIYDLQRNNFEIIPNDFYEILLLLKENSVADLIKIYGKENKSVINQYINFIIKKEFGFWINKNEMSLFPELNYEWDMPNTITNIIIKIGVETVANFKVIIKLIKSLRCESVCLIFKEEVKINLIRKVIKLFDKLEINTIHIIAKLDNVLNIIEYESMILVNKRIDFLFLETTNKELISTNKKIIVGDKYNLKKHESFIINMKMFMEAQFHHTYFNRKLYRPKGQFLAFRAKC